MLKIQKNKYWIGLSLSILLLSGLSFAQDTEQAVKDNLSALMASHVNLSLQSLRDSLDQASGQQQTIADLEANTEDIASIIGDIYDIETGSKFLESWRLRVNYFDDYLMFISSGDEADKTPVIESLAAADNEVASLLETIVSDFSAADAKAQLNSITDLFLASTEDYAAGSTGAAQAKEVEATTQVGVLSQSLGDGVATDLILSLPEPEPIPTTQAPETTTVTTTNPASSTNSDSTDLTTETSPQADSTASNTTSADVEREKRTLVKTTNTEIFIRNDAGGLTPFPFSDVNGAHDYTSILDMKNRGIVSGYDDGTYRPDALVNRAEFTKIVVGSVVSTAYGLNCFSDVGQEWFAAYVCTAKDQDIVGGYPDGSFRPGNEVNLAEAYKIVGETLFPGEATNTNVWYQGYVDLAIEREYYLGAELNVTSSVTRAQLASIVSRALRARES